ncbi:MAG: hypothetical protein HRU27_20635 [Rhizobiaceae bacterium]|nr:hypothetical protein [Rhizobiaceae bacterium]
MSSALDRIWHDDSAKQASTAIHLFDDFNLNIINHSDEWPSVIFQHTTNLHRSPRQADQATEVASEFPCTALCNGNCEVMRPVFAEIKIKPTFSISHGPNSTGDHRELAQPFGQAFEIGRIYFNTPGAPMTPSSCGVFAFRVKQGLMTGPALCRWQRQRLAPGQQSPLQPLILAEHMGGLAAIPVDGLITKMQDEPVAGPKGLVVDRTPDFAKHNIGWDKALISVLQQQRVTAPLAIKQTRHGKAKGAGMRHLIRQCGGNKGRKHKNTAHR